MRIKNKIIISTTVMCLASLMLCFLFYIVHLNYLKNNNAREYRQIILRDYDNDIKYQVENVVSLLTGLYRMYEEGAYTYDEARIQARELVRNLRYGDQGYFWIDNYQGVNVLHPYHPEIEGISRIDAIDREGNKYIRDIIEKGRMAGGGYSEFYFTKGDSNKSFPKRGYSLAFAPFEWVVGTGNYIDDIDKTVEEYDAKFKKEIRQKMSIAIGIFVVLGLFIVISAQFYVERAITRPLSRLVLAFRDLDTGDGDLTRRIEFNTRDELSELAESFNTFTAKIGGVISGIRDVADTLSASADELSSSTVSFSETSQKQASSTEEVVASTEQISAGIDSINELASRQNENLGGLKSKIEALTLEIEGVEEKVDQSRKVTGAINQNSDYGIQALMEMNSTMNGIQKSSQEMDGIIAMIQDISEQINLLSLNASIESARAGEAGRGFAVVAEEVSKLADQTAGSIQNIDALIKLNANEITTGIEKLESTGERVQEIHTGVGQVNEIIGRLAAIMEGQEKVNGEINQSAEDVQRMAEEISSMTAQQKVGMEEIVVLMSKIGEYTQKSAGGSEEMAVTSRELSRLAETLISRVAFFKV